jgi:hypothetical protein
MVTLDQALVEDAMSEHETEGRAGGEEEESWWQRALTWGGRAHTGVEAVEAAGAHGTTLAGTAGSLTREAAEHGGLGLGNILAPLALGSGINEMVNGHSTMERIGGGLEAASGGIGTVGLLGAGASALGDTLAVAGLGGELGAASTIGMNAGIGLSGAGSAMTGAAAAAAPVAAVLGAGAAGIAIGTGMSHASDSDYTRTGLWGQDENGHNRSAQDAAVNWGLDYDREHGVRPGDWSFGGAARSMVGGIGAGIAGTVQAGYNASGLGGVVDGAVDGASNWFGGLDRSIRNAVGVPSGT